MGDPTLGGDAVLCWDFSLIGDPSLNSGVDLLGELTLVDLNPGDIDLTGESVSELPVSALALDDVIFVPGDATLDVGDKDSTSVSSVFSLSGRFLNCTVPVEGEIMLMLTSVPPAERHNPEKMTRDRQRVHGISL